MALDLTDQVSALLQGRVDVALLRLPQTDSDVIVHALFEEPRIVVLPPRHRLADAGQVTAGDLYEELWLNGGGQPHSHSSLYYLGDVWDCRELRYGSIPSRNAADLFTRVDHDRAVLVTAASMRRWGIGTEMPTAALPGISGSAAGVVHRADDTRSTVRDFVVTAKSVSDQLIELVPDAQLVQA